MNDNDLRFKVVALLSFVGLTVFLVVTWFLTTLELNPLLTALGSAGVMGATINGLYQLLIALGKV